MKSTIVKSWYQGLLSQVMQKSPFTKSNSFYAILISACLCVFSSNTFANASKVEIIKSDGQYSLTMNGAAFAVNGVGLGYRDKNWVKALKEAGGNSFRTWSTGNIEEELALAKELDLMIAVGINTGKELLGFDYNNEAAVAEQYKRVTDIIQQYKHHPNILAWVIGNEQNLLLDDNGQMLPVNPKVYKAMGDIVEFIHKNDPNHPVTLTLAAARKVDIDLVLKYIPNIDFLSVQLYGNLDNLSEYIEASGVDKPFMVTEFGPTGHWEMPSTSWGREIEEPSGIKADNFARRIRDNILNDPTGKLIGSFAFFWGQKQERTPTWYGMFNASGHQNARVDELTKIWTGSYPKNRAPRSTKITINEKLPQTSLTLAPSAKANAVVLVTDYDGDPLKTDWILRKEVTARSQGGHFEPKPEDIQLTVLNQFQSETEASLSFIAPLEPGEYRLFAYSYDNKGKVGNANFPFLVK